MNDSRLFFAVALALVLRGTSGLIGLSSSGRRAPDSLTALQAALAGACAVLTTLGIRRIRRQTT